MDPTQNLPCALLQPNSELLGGPNAASPPPPWSTLTFSISLGFLRPPRPRGLGFTWRLIGVKVTRKDFQRGARAQGGGRAGGKCWVYSHFGEGGCRLRSQTCWGSSGGAPLAELGFFFKQSHNFSKLGGEGDLRGCSSRTPWGDFGKGASCTGVTLSTCTDPGKIH